MAEELQEGSRTELGDDFAGERGGAVEGSKPVVVGVDQFAGPGAQVGHGQPDRWVTAAVDAGSAAEVVSVDADADFPCPGDVEEGELGKAAYGLGVLGYGFAVSLAESEHGKGAEAEED